jgi:hypothetical protein
MKIFKSWKSEFKKKGAMALTAFMLCGSFSTAFAQETGSGEESNKIIIRDKETGDIISGDALSTGDTKTVTGYQTDNIGYAANVEWGQMVFVYDRGTYDPGTGTLVGSFQGDENNDKYIEQGGDKKTVGKWYGFDGINNAVTIENRSAAAVDLTVTPKVEGENVNDVEFKLYAGNTSWTNATTSLTNVSHAGTFSFADANTAISKVFGARTFEANGTITDAGKADATDTVYLNITGSPKLDGFMTESIYTNNGNIGEKLGTITLNFKNADKTIDLTEVGVNDDSSGT